MREDTIQVDDIRSLTVVGAGDMGHGIAEVALLAGYKVSLRDIDKELVDKGVRQIDESLKKLMDKGKVTSGHYDRIHKELLHPCQDLRIAVQEADLIIEAIPEIPELKKETFCEIDRYAPPHALLASNTSSIRITEIGKATNRPEKVLGLHFFNPVVLMKLVEVVRGERTTEKTMKVAYDFCLKINKVPVRVEKDLPGFIVNRVNASAHVLRGCILDEGIAQHVEIDALMKKLGMPMGPFELLDYIGLDVHYNALSYFSKTLHPDYAPYRTLEEKVKAGELGKKTGKGFYDWSQGKPRIDPLKASVKVDPMDMTAVQINEATKLIQIGVCSAEDVDRAIMNGTGNNTGPMSIAKDQDPIELTQRLEGLSERFHKKIFLPTQMIRQGSLR